MVAAVRALTGLAGNEPRVRYVLAARPSATVERLHLNTVHDVRAVVGLGHAMAATVVEHGGASGLVAVDLAGQMLSSDEDPSALALVISGEGPDPDLTGPGPGGAVARGGFAACLVAPDAENDVVLGAATRVRGDRLCPGTADSGAATDQDALLSEAVAEAVRDAGVALSDLALVLPDSSHPGSRVRVAARLGLSRGKVYAAPAPSGGHCLAADPFVHHVRARADGSLRRGDLYLMTAEEFGTSCSAMVLRH